MIWRLAFDHLKLLLGKSGGAVKKERPWQQMSRCICAIHKTQATGDCCECVTSYMIPVLLGSCWEFFPSLDQEDAGVADVPTTHLTQPAETDRKRISLTGQVPQDVCLADMGKQMLGAWKWDFNVPHHTKIPCYICDSPDLISFLTCHIEKYDFYISVHCRLPYTVLETCKSCCSPSVARQK